MPAKYVIARKGDRFHWNLLASNGRIIATSEVYNTKQAALTGIRSVQKNGATDVIVTAEEAAAAKAPAKPASVKKAAAEQAPAKKAAAKKAPAKKAPAKKAGGSTTRSARST